MPRDTNTKISERAGNKNRPEPEYFSRCMPNVQILRFCDSSVFAHVCRWYLPTPLPIYRGSESLVFCSSVCSSTGSAEAVGRRNKKRDTRNYCMTPVRVPHYIHPRAEVHRTHLHTQAKRSLRVCSSTRTRCKGGEGLSLSFLSILSRKVGALQYSRASSGWIGRRVPNRITFCLCLCTCANSTS